MASKARTRTNQYLSFRLGNETYAIDVGNAREIVERSALTQIPKTPPWIRGVINLRGRIVPVIDLKLRFDMGRTEDTVNTCVIIVESVVDGELFLVGLLADAAKEVFELEASAMEPPPKFGVSLATQYIRGMVKRGSELLVILDVQRVFSLEELAEVQEIGDDADSLPGEAAEDSPCKLDDGWDNNSVRSCGVDGACPEP